MTPKFSLGRAVITRAALDVLSETDVRQGLTRHVSGDWGDLCNEDVEANETALREGLRLLSRYQCKDGTVFWIITEADRSVTTVLLPEDY